MKKTNLSLMKKKLEEESQQPILISTSSDNHHSDDDIDSSENRIYFYSEVDRTSVLGLIKKITEVSNSLKANQILLTLKDPGNIFLHINSYGGSVFDAFCAVNYIENSDIPIISSIDGYAASAASLLSVCAHKRVMFKNSLVLIHQLSSWFEGTYENWKDEVKNIEILMNRIKAIYEARTKLPKKKLEDLLKHDLWLTAEKCIEYGIVDEII